MKTIRSLSRKPVIANTSVAGFLLMACIGAANAGPGAMFHTNGTFTDTVSGVEYSVSIRGMEDIGENVGHTEVFLEGLSEYGYAIQACSTHGSNANMGVFPLRNIQCGGAGRMMVAINGCAAEIQTHGYVHSDYPYVTYSGPTTIDIRLKKNDGRWKLSVEIYTPKTREKLEGILNGDTTVSTCQ